MWIALKMILHVLRLIKNKFANTDWQCVTRLNAIQLLFLQILNAYVSPGSKKSDGQTVSRLSDLPVYFSRRLGGNMIIYRLLHDPMEAVNIKHGIVNLFHYQTQPGEMKEVSELIILLIILEIINLQGWEKLLFYFIGR